MNLLRDYFRIALRSPDDPVAPEPEPAPVVEAVAEPVAADAPEPAPVEPEPAPAPVVTTPPAMVPLRVMQERIGEEASKRQAAEERARSYEEIVKRLQAEPKPAAVDPQNPPAPVTRTATPPAIDQNAVQQEASRQLFQRDLANVSEAGFKAYGQPWNEAINALNAYGANSAEFVSSVMEIDQSKAHEIMFDIAQDPEKAVSLAKMTPARRISEITRMVMAKTATAEPKPAEPVVPAKSAAVSRAPAPKPAIAPHAPAPDVDPTTPEGNEKMSDAEWSQWYKNKYMKRSA